MNNLIAMANVYYFYFKNIILLYRLKFHTTAV